ncbi:MAG TPA: hypothetical protein VIL85_03205 [Thermomicrobiales bacterium]|jgi:catechol 2,3-dioxygenase-like lactoylglutathione lyase family enzyme
MAIVIDYIALPAHDHERSARFFAQIIGLSYDGPERHFAPVRVNPTFTIAFLRAEDFSATHLGFAIGEGEFATILGNLQAAGIAYGNSPRDPQNGRTDHPFGGLGLFFTDLNGHLFEVMTQTR